MSYLQEQELQSLDNSAQIFNALSDVPGDVEDVDDLIEVVFLFHYEMARRIGTFFASCGDQTCHSYWFYQYIPVLPIFRIFAEIRNFCYPWKFLYLVFQLQEKKSSKKKYFFR